MTSGSFQTQPRDLYVELYLRVGQIITTKSKWSYIQFQAGSMVNEFFLLQLEQQTVQHVVLSQTFY